MSRKRAAEAVDVYHQAVIINSDPTIRDTLASMERRILNQFITVFGCVIPENDTHYIFKCPIRLRQLLPRTGISPSILLKEPSCSICNRDILDPECEHLIGEDYEGKVAVCEVARFEAIEVSIVDRPRDSRAKITALSIPKKDVEKSFTEEELRMEKLGAGVYCHYCRNTPYTPDEITYDQFIEMQKSDPPSLNAKGPSYPVKPDGIYERIVIPFDEIIGGNTEDKDKNNSKTRTKSLSQNY